MTDANIRANVADEMALADSDLRAADALLGLAICPAAASRTPDEIQPELDKARRFVEDARALLRGGGWLS